MNSIRFISICLAKHLNSNISGSIHYSYIKQIVFTVRICTPNRIMKNAIRPSLLDSPKSLLSSIVKIWIYTVVSVLFYWQTLTTDLNLHSITFYSKICFKVTQSINETRIAKDLVGRILCTWDRIHKRAYANLTKIMQLLGQNIQLIYV